jgi:hypothetical protein
MFDRDDQRGFDVGSGTVPAGLSALVDLLHRLQSQTAATPACSGLLETDAPTSLRPA